MRSGNRVDCCVGVRKRIFQSTEHPRLGTSRSCPTQQELPAEPKGEALNLRRRWRSTGVGASHRRAQRHCLQRVDHGGLQQRHDEDHPHTRWMHEMRHSTPYPTRMIESNCWVRQSLMGISSQQLVVFIWRQMIFSWGSCWNNAKSYARSWQRRRHCVSGRRGLSRRRWPFSRQQVVTQRRSRRQTWPSSSVGTNIQR